MNPILSSVFQVGCEINWFLEWDGEDTCKEDWRMEKKTLNVGFFSNIFLDFHPENGKDLFHLTRIVWKLGWNHDLKDQLGSCETGWMIC